MLLGLRGVGKTVLLNRTSELAEDPGYQVAMLEAPEGQRRAQYLAPALKSALLRTAETWRSIFRNSSSRSVRRPKQPTRASPFLSTKFNTSTQKTCAR